MKCRPACATRQTEAELRELGRRGLRPVCRLPQSPVSHAWTHAIVSRDHQEIHRGVLLDDFVRGYQTQIFHCRLRDQYPIEGILVERRQGINRGNVLRAQEERCSGQLIERVHPTAARVA